MKQVKYWRFAMIKNASHHSSWSKKGFLKSTIMLSIVIIFGSCRDSSGQPEMQFTPEIALDSIANMSPENGAAFYKESRTTYDFLDKLYQDSIAPALKYCNYYELKGVCYYLQDTPCYDMVFDFFKAAKESYAKSIRKELRNNCNHEKEIFEQIVIPSIEMGTDSMLNENIEEAFNEYAGGFMNYRNTAVQRKYLRHDLN